MPNLHLLEAHAKYSVNTRTKKSRWQQSFAVLTHDCMPKDGETATLFRVARTHDGISSPRHKPYKHINYSIANNWHTVTILAASTACLKGNSLFPSKCRSRTHTHIHEPWDTCPLNEGNWNNLNLNAAFLVWHFILLFKKNIYKLWIVQCELCTEIE